MGKKNRMVVAEKNKIYSRAVAAASGSTSNNLLIQNLKTMNACLVKEVAKCQIQIQQLRLQLSVTAAENDIFNGIQRDVFMLVISSIFDEAVTHIRMKMASITERERNLRIKIESAASEVNVMEVKLFAVVTEKDVKVKELVGLKESIQSMEQASRRERRWRKWFCTVLSAIFMAVVAAILTIFLHKF